MRVRSGGVDRVIALLLAPILGPVTAVLGWKVRRQDGEAALIGLDRVGRGGRSFRMWKLRSMRVVEADGRASGSVITASDDDRITPFGAVLRRWRMDELPQLWNVIRGDMGLFGPRPETPTLVDADDPRWQAVLTARPGVAGPTQLVVEEWESAVLAAGSQEDRYRDEILPVKLAIDRWYVEHATPLVDLQVAWSMLERFVLGRSDTAVQRLVRREVPESSAVPRACSGG